MFERCGVNKVVDIREGMELDANVAVFPPKRFKGQI